MRRLNKNLVILSTNHLTHLKVVVHYSLLVVLLRLLFINLLRILYYTISSLHLNLLVTPIGLFGMHLQVQVDYLDLVVVLSLEHMITVRHHMISGLMLIGVLLVM